MPPDVVYRMSPNWSKMYFLEDRSFIADTDEPRDTWLEEYILHDVLSSDLAALAMRADNLRRELDAEDIGATLQVEPAEDGGTFIRCALLLEKVS